MTQEIDMQPKSYLRLLRALAAAGGLLAQCGSTPDWPTHAVEARLIGEVTHTTVDSEFAREFLEEILIGNAASDLKPKFRALIRKYDSRDLNAESLDQLSKETSPDFATAYFIRRVWQRSENLTFQKQFYTFVSALRGDARKQDLSQDKDWNRRIRDNYVFLFAPGLLYKSKPEARSDMRPQRELLEHLGFRSELLAVHQAGSVEKNARVIADAVRRHRNSKVVLVSASKGGPDVAQALGSELTEAESRHVQAWVNVGGAIGGSPLADEMLDSWEMPFARVYGWYLGVDACELASSLSVKASRARELRQSIPERIFVLNYVAVPFSGSVVEEVRGPYGRLRRLGPNDGIVLLTEQSTDDDQMILAIGSDHRFKDPEIHIKTLALARIVLERVEGAPEKTTMLPARRSQARDYPPIK
jgi:hypothetical protein